MTAEGYGPLVRKVFSAWARVQPNPKPSWLTPWNGLTDPEREVDILIGDAVAAAERARLLARVAAAATTLVHPGNGPWQWDETVVVPLDRLRELLGGDG